MIRDTAYDGILKRARADLHTRFVDWADEVNRDRGVEFEEILGYHLEQAWGYLSELGPLDERGREIGEDGSRRLASAGRRAFARGDVPAAASLLGRAAALLPGELRAPASPARARGSAPDDGPLRRGDRGAGRGDLGTRGCAVCRGAREARAAARAAADGRRRTGDPSAVEEEIAATIEVFRDAADEAGLAMAWRLLAWVAGIACRFGEAAIASRHAIEHAKAAGDIRQERRATATYAAAAALGPTLVDEAIERCEAAIELTAGRPAVGGNRALRAGDPLRDAGRVRPCARACRRARTLFEELGLEMDKARLGMETSSIERLAGDLEAAERELRGSYDALDAVGERYVLSTVAGLPRADAARARRDRGGERDVRAEPGARDRRRRRDARRCGGTSADGSSPGRTPLPRESGSRARRSRYLAPTEAIAVPDRGPARPRRDAPAAGAPRRGARRVRRRARSSPRKRAAS